jgi:hypothetical protein
MIYLAAMLPGLVLIAEIARRMAKLLRAAQESDPFTGATARVVLYVSSSARCRSQRAPQSLGSFSCR